jgi:hypothetical protein
MDGFANFVNLLSAPRRDAHSAFIGNVKGCSVGARVIIE